MIYDCKSGQLSSRLINDSSTLQNLLQYTLQRLVNGQENKKRLSILWVAIFNFGFVFTVRDFYWNDSQTFSDIQDGIPLFVR